MSNNELQAKVDKLRELRQMSDELTAAIENAQNEVKAYMTAIGVDELSGVDYKVTWKNIISARLDIAALKKALPEVAAAYTKEITSRRFCLS